MLEPQSSGEGQRGLAPEQQLLMTTWHSIGMVLVFTTAVPWLLSHSNCLAVDGRCLRSLPVQQLGTSSTQNCTERTTACRAVPAACPPLEVCLAGGASERTFVCSKSNFLPEENHVLRIPDGLRYSVFAQNCSIHQTQKPTSVNTKLINPLVSCGCVVDRSAV